MTALAGMALLCEGSTTTQGKYAPNIRKAVDYLVSRSRPQRLDRRSARDDRYTYGHGFSMLFLSQVLGEEEDADRREELIDVLTRAVKFTGEAQTAAGGWGYVSAKDGNDFDEGSTTITQVRLRGCRNAGIPVPKEIIDKAVELHPQMHRPRRRRAVQFARAAAAGPPITAAAIACLFNAGDYDSEVRAQAVELLRAESRRHLSQPGLRPLALRPLLLCPGHVPRRRREVGRVPRQDLHEDLCPRPAPTALGTRATSARSTPRPST